LLISFWANILSGPAIDVLWFFVRYLFGPKYGMIRDGFANGICTRNLCGWK
jgi:hypothetical protein